MFRLSADKKLPAVRKIDLLLSQLTIDFQRLMAQWLGPNVNRLLVNNEYPDLTLYGHFAQPEKVIIMSRRGDLVALLKKTHADRVQVAVYPNAEIQYSTANSGSKVLSFISDG